jgi:hypothetical protein
MGVRCGGGGGGTQHIFWTKDLSHETFDPGGITVVLAWLVADRNFYENGTAQIVFLGAVGPSLPDISSLRQRSSLRSLRRLFAGGKWYVLMRD